MIFTLVGYDAEQLHFVSIISLILGIFSILHLRLTYLVQYQTVATLTELLIDADHRDALDSAPLLLLFTLSGQLSIVPGRT